MIKIIQRICNKIRADREESYRKYREAEERLRKSIAERNKAMERLKNIDKEIEEDRKRRIGELRDQLEEGAKLNKRLKKITKDLKK